MTRLAKVGTLAVLLLSTGALRLSTAGASGEVVRVDVRADVSDCVQTSLESAAAGQGLVLVFARGASAEHEGDILIARGHELTRALEGGAARAGEFASLGRDRGRAIGAVVTSDAVGARRLFEALGTSAMRASIDRCHAEGALTAQSEQPPAALDATSVGTGQYATAVTDWWLPTCSKAYNGYNDPAQVVGAPDALRFGKDDYTGIMSLGEGGYVTVDMGAPVADHAGPELRVYQTTSLEPVTLYAAAAAAGPFTLVGLQRECGARIPHMLSGYCDFDLAEAGLKSARFLKIEDGEIYPCAAGDTITEGADIDAVEILAAP